MGGKSWLKKQTHIEKKKKKYLPVTLTWAISSIIPKSDEATQV